MWLAAPGTRGPQTHVRAAAAMRAAAFKVRQEYVQFGGGVRADVAVRAVRCHVRGPVPSTHYTTR